jgi:hypothetical protein
MNGLFEELRRKLESDAGKRGISAWELAQLPAGQRRVIRLILREVQMPYPELCRVTAALPAGQRLEQADLDEVLTRLQEKAWLIRLGQGQLTTYRVNLRRKSGSRLANSIWERLDRQIGAQTPRQPDRR